MSMAVITIVCLIVAIAIGFFRQLNVGILSIMGAFIVGHMMGLNDKQIISGFNGNLFVTLMGVTFLFSILNSNGTIQLLATRSVSLVGSHNWLIPIVIFLTGYIMTGLGPGAIPMLAIMPAFAIPVAIARGYNPIMMALIADFGVFGGRMSPITPESILVRELLAKGNIVSPELVTVLIANETLTGVVCALIAFIYYKGYKVKHVQVSEKVVPFNRQQWFSLVGLLTMVVLVIFFKHNVGLVSFTVGGALLCLGVAEESKSIKGIPWSVLIMICGVGTLMKLVVESGGITIISDFLAILMNSGTASGIMGIIAGIMSWFSSGLGVVFPTLLPTVAGLAEAIGDNVNAIEMASLIVIGGTFTGVSPFSTTGGLILATLMTDETSANTDVREHKSRKIFIELLIWSCITLVVLATLAFTGVYGLLYKLIV